MSKSVFTNYRRNISQYPNDWNLKLLGKLRKEINNHTSGQFNYCELNVWRRIDTGIIYWAISDEKKDISFLFDHIHKLKDLNKLTLKNWLQLEAAVRSLCNGPNKTKNKDFEIATYGDGQALLAIVQANFKIKQKAMEL